MACSYSSPSYTMDMSGRDPHGGRFSRPRPSSRRPRQSSYRVNRPMRIPQLLDLQWKDPLHVALTLKSERSGFRLLISQSNLRKDTITIILKVISVACSSQRKENLSEMLKIVSSVSSFMNQLRWFLGDMKQTISKNCGPCMEHILIFLEALSSAHPVTSKPDLQSFLPLLTAVLDCRIGNNNCSLTKRTEKLWCMVSSAKQLGGNLDLVRPLKSFRDISIYPGEDDMQPNPDLKPNLVKGKYTSVESYLDIQFRLFREDYVRPLRENITSYRKQRNEGITSHFKDVRVYRNVRLGEALLTVDDGIVHKIHFYYDENINWESSKRLIYGSLICLSVNDFKTMLVATVAASKPYELKRGVVYIRFAEEHMNEAHRLKDRTFVAIETDAYFEAYRHVLTVLQEFNPQTFPMKEYIVDVSNQPKRPNYLCGNKFYCLRGVSSFPVPTSIEELIHGMKTLFKAKVGTEDVSDKVTCQCHHVNKRTTFPVLDLDTWPNEEQFALDETQIAAFKSALTQKLSLIQGPPGTGKTHVGLKIVHALLHNQHYQLNTTERVLRNPILVVCYTNHALDQFLEGVLKITDKVVRVGGRSESQALSNHNLKHLKKTSYNDFTRTFRSGVRQSLEMSIEMIESLQQLKQEANVRLLTDTEIKEYLPENQWLSLGNDHPAFMSLSPNCLGNFIHYWLGSLFPPHFYYEVDGNVYLWLDDTLEEIEQLLEDMAYSEFLYHNIVSPQRSAEVKQYSPRAPVKQDKNDVTETSQRTRHPNMADLGDAADLDFIRAQRMEEDDVLKDAKVIYGTNEKSTNSPNTVPQTFVSRQLKCKPISDKERNQCWNVWKLRLPDRWRLYKSWILTLNAEVEIRIKKLKEDYHRDLKLYDELRQERERLVTQGFDVVGMTTTGAAKYKHLMRGLKPRVVIVEEAAEVQESHVVSSLSENTEHLILIGDHQQLRPNPACYELAKNYGLDISLFERLVNNGLPYCRLGIQHRMRPCISQLLVPHIYASLQDHSSVKLYEDVRGMEKNMFFLNHSFHEKQLNTSKCNEFEAEFLVMLCKHLVLQGYEPQQITILSTYLAQFALIKSKASNVPLIKGARITVVDNYQGEENDIVLVSFVRSNERGSIGFLKTDNRVCVALSRAKSGFYCIGNFDLLRKESSLWMNIVAKLREQKAIGSSLVTKCHIHNTLFAITKASDFENIPGGGCKLACSALLTCGHKCMQKCHPRDPNHEEYNCSLPCMKINTSCEFGHRCTRPCWVDCGPCVSRVLKVITPCLHRQYVPCSVNPEGVTCQKPCQERFPCGHKCPLMCGEPCPECTSPVYRLAPCGHNVQVPCNVSDVESAVAAACKQPCNKNLACGHTCTSYCGSNCVTHCLVVQEKQIPCGHLSEVLCYRKHDDDDSLMRTCRSPCDAVLMCGHQCKGTCGECMQGKLHVPCMERCEKELLCGHVIKNALCFKTVPSCKERCRNSCPHRRCIFPCSCVCVPCKSQCTWRCDHYQCSKTCEEECDRPACVLPCSKFLKCGHSCLGYCGELCPPRCYVCDKGNLVDLRLCEDEPVKGGPCERRLIVLENCGHIFDCEDLEVRLKRRHQSAAEDLKSIRIPKCPVCETPLRRSGRLGVFVKECRIKVENVKRIMFGSTLKNEQKRSTLLRRICSLKLESGRYGTDVDELLMQLKLPITNKKQPHHMLMCIEGYIKVCEELSSIRSTLLREKVNTTIIRTVCEITGFIIKRLLSTLGSMNHQLSHDVKGEINRLWLLVPSEARNHQKQDGRKDRQLTNLAFLVGSWYLCSKEHALCLNLQTKEDDFMCKECELSQKYLCFK